MESHVTSWFGCSSKNTYRSFLHQYFHCAGMCVNAFKFIACFAFISGVLEGTYDSQWCLCNLERLDRPTETGWYGLPGIWWRESTGKTACPWLLCLGHLSFWKETRSQVVITHFNLFVFCLHFEHKFQRKLYSIEVQKYVVVAKLVFQLNQNIGGRNHL